MVQFSQLTAAALLAASVLADVPAGIVRFPMDRLSPNHISRRATDGGAVEGILSNMKTYYALRCSLGTPAQDLRLVIDTGSSDFWVMSPNTEECRAGKCQTGSIFDPTKSKTFHNNNTQFAQHYADDTGATGTWAQDVFSLGNNVTINNFNFAVASQANSSQTVAGIGLDKGETPYILQTIDSPYQNLPIQLKSNGYISHVAYSLYLDSFSDGVGSVLFGGVNTGAYEGDIYVFPMVPVDTPNVVDRLAIKMQSMYLMDDNGNQQIVLNTSIPVVFDSGSTISAFPDEMISPLMKSLGAFSYEGMYLLDCDNLANNHGGLGFTFSGVEYIINFRDILVELAESRQGTKYCVPGFIPGSIPLLGDNVLRALYIVYDLENLEIGIAKANTASSISTSYQTIGSSIPGTRAPGYSNSEVDSTYEPFPITLFSASAAANPSFSGSFSESVERSGSATVMGSSTPSSAPSASNDVSITVGGKDTTSGLVTPYGGFGTKIPKEASVSGNTIIGNGGSNPTSNSSPTSSANRNSQPSSSDSSISTTSRHHKSKNEAGANSVGMLGSMMAVGAGVFLMLV